MTQKSDKYLHTVEIRWLSESQDIPRLDSYIEDDGQEDVGLVNAGDIDLDAILYEMTDGEFCGTVIYKGCDTLSHEATVAKLVELGNDGKFFEVGDEVPTEEEPSDGRPREKPWTNIIIASDAAASAKAAAEASDASRTVLMQSISYREEVDLTNKAETLIDLASAEIKAYQEGSRLWVIAKSQDQDKFWSTINGWVSLEFAARFNNASRSTYELPAGGQWKEAVYINGVPVLCGVTLGENDPCPYIVPRPKFGLMLRAKRTRWTDLGRISKKQFFVRFSFLAETQIVVEMCPYSLVEMPNAPDKTPYVVFDNDQDALRFFLGSLYLSTIDGVKRYVVVHLDDDGNLVGQ